MTTLIAVLLGLQAASAPAPATAPPERPPVRVYTNEDLERVHPFRRETGVASVPANAADPEPAPGGAPRTPKARTRGEDYWRREAARVRRRVDALAARAEALRSTLAERDEERRHTLGRRRSGGTSDATLERRLAAIERHMRRLEDELRERARREGALPGWLR
jgi:septal ring factor EnvC (AmiA/AmiB activator)